MNEVLRLLDKVLKKQGYSIKKHPEYNLLPLMSFEGFSDQELAYNKFNSKKQKINSEVKKLEVILRTCINDKRAKGKRSELTGVSLEEHLLTCINSLFISINYAKKNNIDVSLTVFDDRSDTSVLEKLNSLCSGLTCEWKVVTTKETGQGPSLHEHFSYVKENDELVYFCEDDYLHEEVAISEMATFYSDIYERAGSHLVIHPQEHEQIYSQFSYPSYILLGKNRRWRTMSHQTHTFFTHSHVVDKYWSYFENTKYMGLKNSKLRHQASEAKTTNLLFNHIPGFSPIPAVGIHFQSEGCLPPFYDWKSLWQKNKSLLDDQLKKACFISK